MEGIFHTFLRRGDVLLLTHTSTVRQGTPGWAGYSVRRKDRCWLRGFRVRRGCPPNKDIRRQEEREGRVDNSYVTISDGD